MWAVMRQLFSVQWRSGRYGMQVSSANSLEARLRVVCHLAALSAQLGMDLCVPHPEKSEDDASGWWPRAEITA